VVVETIQEDIVQESPGVEGTEEEWIEEDMDEDIKAENLALKARSWVALTLFLLYTN
jgi:hypothetical protein